MAKPLAAAPDLYDRDFFAWTEEQAVKLRARAHNEIDWDNAAEEIETLGRSEKKEIRSRLRILILHLLKWEFQPRLRSQGWQTTITEQRIHISESIDDSPSLFRFPEAALEWAYNRAVREAGREAGLAKSDLPVRSPWSADKILDPDFLPGAPWSPETLIRD